MGVRSGPGDGVEAGRLAEYFSMGLFNRKKQAADRVQDLKTRVESLRKVDDEHRALTLDDFLQGDDTVTSRSEPRLTHASQGAPAPVLPDENSLEAELQRYLQRQENEEASLPEAEEDAVIPMSDWGFDAPVTEPPQPLRPISIDEFPPLPPPEERFVAEFEAEVAGASASPKHSPPRLSADEEAAFIAELQRYVEPEPIEAAEADAVASLPNPEMLAAEDFSWSESPVEPAPVEETFAISFDAPELPAEPVVEVEALVAKLMEDEEPEPTSKIVQLEGRSYEEPQPRRWPSVPLASPEAEVAPEKEPARWPRAAGDWEPL